MKLSVRSEGMPGTKRLQSKFKKLARKIGNKNALFQRIGVNVLNEIIKTFKEETHEGKPWKPLSPSTIARRGGGLTRILQDTGTLRRSFGSKATSRLVRIGTPILYAPTHQEGERKIPQRQMLPSKKRGLEIAVKVTDNYIKEGIRKARL